MDDKFLVGEKSTWSFFTLGAIVGFSLGYYYWRSRLRAKIQEQESNSNEERIIEYSSNNKVYRMIIGVRNDLKMGKGKVAAQVAHAAVAAYVKCAAKAPRALNKWSKHGQAKITVRLDSEAEMMQLVETAKANGILVSIIRDAGHTQVDPDTRTVVAFGPAPKDDLDKITGHLKLY